MDSTLEIGSEAGLLVEGMKSMHLSLSSSPLSPLSPTTSSPSLLSLSTASSSSSDDFPTVASPADFVDCFLQEALNSRNRMTVLRLEQEIEKFAGNTKQQQLLLKPMLSSYERLVAYRVAQYYHLQSTAVESDTPPGSRILLSKTPDSKLPSVRLVDIPTDQPLNERPASPPMGKVAIKQRSCGARSNNDAISAAKMTPRKSVEERTEEYNKARARIFSSSDLVNRKDGGGGGVCRVDQHATGEVPMSAELVSVGPERDLQEEEAILRAANRVAVFRDREKDIRDPDYDRSYGRYSPPLRPGIVINARTHGVNAIMHGVNGSMHGLNTSMHGGCGCANASMQCQGGVGNSHPGVTPVFYRASMNQEGRPWGSLTGVPVLGYPCALPGPQRYSSSNMYVPNQKLIHSGDISITNWSQFPAKFEPYPRSSYHVMEWFRSY